MRILLSLASSLVELAACFTKWLFIATAPVLLIVAVSYHQAGKSCLEPLVGMVLVSGLFTVIHWLSLEVEGPRLLGLRNGLDDCGATSCAASGEIEFWNWHPQEEGLRQTAAKKEARRNNDHHAELWRQANPWGGYNPHE